MTKKLHTYRFEWEDWKISYESFSDEWELQEYINAIEEDTWIWIKEYSLEY